MIWFFFYLIIYPVYGQLSYLKHHIIDKSFQEIKYPIGGLSGWIYNDQKFYAASDGNNDYGPNRVIVLSKDLSPIKEVFLKTPIEQDFEGITIRDETLYLVSEGPQPGLYKFDLEGNQKGHVPFDYNFQHNKGPEGLTHFKDLFLISFERELKEDLKGIKFLLYEKEKLKKSYYYQLDQIEKERSPDSSYGVSEILLESNDSFLSLEKGFDPKTKKNWIKIYRTKFKDSFFKKEKLIELDKNLPEGLSSLDNMEAMTFGPIVNGKKTLWLVSDDNFSKHQKNLVLVFTLQ